MVIVTPSGLHGSKTREAFYAGLYAFCEKPLDSDLSEAGKTVKVVESNRSFPERFGAAFWQKCRNL
jgi:predicted dehydrogenase